MKIMNKPINLSRIKITELDRKSVIELTAELGRTETDRTLPHWSMRRLPGVLVNSRTLQHGRGEGKLTGEKVATWGDGHRREDRRVAVVEASKSCHHRDAVVPRLRGDASPRRSWPTRPLKRSSRREPSATMRGPSDLAAGCALASMGNCSVTHAECVETRLGWRVIAWNRTGQNPWVG